MKTVLMLACSLGVALLLATCIIVPVVITSNDGNERAFSNNTYALLIAGSKGWINYRHQADIAHAYHLLIDKGVPRENVVVMMYDDIANNPSNPQKGQIRNSPNGPDYYAGLNIDYRLGDVSLDVFRSVLKGDAEAVKGKGTGRVIESTYADNLFLYYADHGGVGIVALPSGELLTRWELESYIKESKFHKMAVYIEACESGSMLEGMENDNRVFGLTASTASQPSYAAYCTDGICYGDEFSVRWMEDSEKFNLNKHDNEQQFTDVRNAVVNSQVTRFGANPLSTIPVSHFQGLSGDSKSFTKRNVEISTYAAIDARDVPIYYYDTVKTNGKTNEERQEAEKILYNIYERRNVAHLFVDTLIEHTTMNSNQLPTEPGICYKQLLFAFQTKCLPLGNSPYLAKLISKLQYLQHELGCDYLSKRLVQACEVLLPKYTFLEEIV